MSNAKKWIDNNRKKEINIERSVGYFQWRFSKWGNDKDKMHFDNIIRHLNSLLMHKSDDEVLFSKLFIFILVNQMSINPYGGNKSWIKLITTILERPLSEHIKDFTDAHNLNQYGFLLDIYGIEGFKEARTRSEIKQIQKDNKENFEANKEELLTKFKEAKMSVEEGEKNIKMLLAEIIAEYELKP